MLEFKDLKELRKILHADICVEDFHRYYQEAVPHVGLEYIIDAWRQYSDAPLLYLTYHSYGEALFNIILREHFKKQ